MRTESVQVISNIGNITGRVNGHLTVFPQRRRRSSYRRMTDLAGLERRISQQLDRLGMSASQASEKAGLSADAIRNVRRAANGARKSKGVSTDTVTRLADYFEVSVGWLLTGEGDAPAEVDTRTIPTVPLVGYVGAGATAHFYAIADENLDEVPAPEGSTPLTRAVEIRGDSLGSLFDRWLVFYDDVRSPITPDLIGRLCVVGLADDRVLIKKIRRARDGLYDLLSDDRREEPIRSVPINWAARVKTMVPR